MLCFYMAVDRPPFDDDQACREAFRLIPDRQALIDGAISGFGTLGNDLFGKGYKYFAEDLPVREADPEKAKALLKEAGHENLEVTLHTSDAVPGFVESATLFAQQAKAAGVTVNIKKESPSAFFDTSLLYTKLDFSQDFWAAGSLGAWFELALLSTAAWNETHWRKPETDALIREAQGAPDEATAEEKFRELQQTQYDEGGYIIWTNINIVDAARQLREGDRAELLHRARRLGLQERLARQVTETRRPSAQRPAGFLNTEIRDDRARRADPDGRAAVCATASSARALRVHAGAGRDRDAVRRLDPRLRRHRGAAGRRGERGARQVGGARRSSPRCAS